MNQEEGFQQRWELRRSKAEGDTSSDDDSRGAPNDKKHNIVTDLILFENDEADDDPSSHNIHVNEKKLHIQSGIDSQTVKDDEKKLKSSKKNKVVRKKSGGSVVKGISRKRKVHCFNDDKDMLNDLKIFADSLVRELAVAQDNMFAHMQDEMRKIAAAESVRRNLRRSLKKVSPKNGSMQRKVDMNPASCNKMCVATPKAIPTSQVQNERNTIHHDHHIPYLNNHSSLPLRLGGLQPQEQFGGFSLNYHKSWGLYGESRSCISSRGVGIPPFPLHQGMESGTIASRSSLSYMNDNKGVASVGRFPMTSRASSERVIHNGIISRMSVGEFVQERSQGKKY